MKLLLPKWFFYFPSVELKGAQAGGVVGAQEEECRLLEKARLAVECVETLFYSLEEGAIAHYEETKIQIQDEH